MGENIKAGIDCLHSNGNTYHIIEIRLVGGRNVAMGREAKADGTMGRTVVLALDKLSAWEGCNPAPAEPTPPETVLGTDPEPTDGAHVSAQDVADLTGNAWEGCYPEPPTADVAHAAFMATDVPDGFPAEFPTSLEIVPCHGWFEVIERNAQTGHPSGRYGFATLEAAKAYVARRNPAAPDDDMAQGRADDASNAFVVSRADRAFSFVFPDDTSYRYPIHSWGADAAPVARDAARRWQKAWARGDRSHAESPGTTYDILKATPPTAPDGWDAVDTDTDDNPPRTLAPNDDAGPITRNDLIDARDSLVWRLVAHKAGLAPMTPGSVAVAERTLASLARTIGPDPTPSQPGPLGIYDRQGAPKRSRRRRRSQCKAHAPKSLFRARSDRKARLIVQNGQRPPFGSAFSAN